MKSTPVTPLKLARVRANLSQERLADLIGTYQVRLSRIERGKASPTSEEALLIAQALGVKVMDIFPELVQ